MSTEPRTVEQWLSYGNDLPVELAKVFTPKPWAHEYQDWICIKCGRKSMTLKHFFCPVSDPIDIKDWNTAMERFRKMPKTEYTIKVMHKIYRLETGMRATRDRTLFEWFLFTASTEALLIVAAMAMDRSKE